MNFSAVLSGLVATAMFVAIGIKSDDVLIEHSSNDVEKQADMYGFSSKLMLEFCKAEFGDSASLMSSQPELARAP